MAGYGWRVSDSTAHHGNPPGPAPASALRRELRSRAQRLKARLILGRKGLTEPFLAELRGELKRQELVKVRLDEEDAEEADRLARALAKAVPCHFLQRIGRVALLYQPGGKSS